MPLIFLTTDTLHITLDTTYEPYPYSGVLTCGEEFFDCFPQKQASQMVAIFQQDISALERIEQLIQYLKTLNKDHYPKAVRLANYLETQITPEILEQKDAKTSKEKSLLDEDQYNAKILLAALNKILSAYIAARKTAAKDLLLYREQVRSFIIQLDVNIRSHRIASREIINGMVLDDLIDEIPLILVKNGFDFRDFENCYSLLLDQAISHDHYELTSAILQTPGFHVNYARYRPPLSPASCSFIWHNP